MCKYLHALHVATCIQCKQDAASTLPAPCRVSRTDPQPGPCNQQEEAQTWALATPMQVQAQDAQRLTACVPHLHLTAAQDHASRSLGTSPRPNWVLQGRQAAREGQRRRRPKRWSPI